MAHCLFNIFLLLLHHSTPRLPHQDQQLTAQLLRNGSSISSVSFNSITLELVVVVNSSSTTSNEALNPKASRLRAQAKKQLQSVRTRFQWQPHTTLHYTTPVLVCQNVAMCKLAYHALINNHTEKMPASK